MTNQPRLSVDVVIPVYNEAHVLARSMRNLAAFMERELSSYDWRILVANNASTDGTLEAARQLAAEDPRIAVLHLDQKGRGRALKRAWMESTADVMCYMDVDLSTDLQHLPPLVSMLASGECDLVIGDRLSRQSATKRSFRREFISRAYNLIVRAAFSSRVEDAQCGFKGINRRVAQTLVPWVEDTQWFFDTELLLIAESQGYRICQLPVRWVEDPDSRVKIVRTALDDLKGLWRMRTGGVAKVKRAVKASG